MSPHNNTQDTSGMDSHTNLAPASSGALLNCIVDESALLAGLSESVTEGIKNWITAGAINVFVPLYSTTFPSMSSVTLTDVFQPSID